MEKYKNRDIFNWIEQSVEDEQFEKKEIVLTGATGKTEGYSGDVVFAKVSGVDTVGKNKEVNLAIKMAKMNKVFREKFPLIREYSMREKRIYENIVPAFRKFQDEKKIVDGFDAVPKCYKTFITDSAEVIVLENLRTKGYKLHDRKKPMNLQHIELVLDSYAKFHAIAFAFQDQKGEKYKALTSDYNLLNIQLIKNFSGPLRKARLNVMKNLNDASRGDLAEKYDKALKNKSLFDVFNDEIEQIVITHGDCHNNNFIFQYKDDDEEDPTRVAIIDWQTSSQHSPALDLGFFLYATSGERIYQVEDLLKFYHSRLIKYAKEMGTDLNRAYPFSSLIRDWRRHSFYGFVIITSFLGMCYVNEEDALDYDDMKDGDELEFDMKIKTSDAYLERLIAMVDQYCNHQI